MASASEDLQKAILNALLADAGVSAVVGDRVHDGRPISYPSITFGPSDVLPEDLDCIDGLMTTVQIDCWTRDENRLRPVKALADRVRQALHRARLQLETHALVNLSVVSTRSFMDPDELTGHGIVTVEAEIEER